MIETEGINVEGLRDVVGSIEGSAVVGLKDGSSVGNSVGTLEGYDVGARDGLCEGIDVGPALGKHVGRRDIVG